MFNVVYLVNTSLRESYSLDSRPLFLDNVAHAQAVSSRPSLQGRLVKKEARKVSDLFSRCAAMWLDSVRMSA